MSPSTIPLSSQPSNSSDLRLSILSRLASTPDRRTVPHCQPFNLSLSRLDLYGATDYTSFIHSLDAAYHEVTHWVRNSFRVPRTAGAVQRARLFVASLFRSVLQRRAQLLSPLV